MHSNFLAIHFLHLSSAFTFPSPELSSLFWYCFSSFPSVCYYPLYCWFHPLISICILTLSCIPLLITLSQVFLFQVDYLYYSSLLSDTYFSAFNHLCPHLSIQPSWWHVTRFNLLNTILSFSSRFSTAYCIFKTFILF